MDKSELNQKLQYEVQIFPIQLFFNFVRKKSEGLRFIISSFTTISGHFSANCIEIFHKTEVQMVILRYLVCLNLNWIKSNNTILLKVVIFSCLEIHYFKADLPKSFLTIPKEINSHWFKMAPFPKFFRAFKKHIIR